MTIRLLTRITVSSLLILALLSVSLLVAQPAMASSSSVAASGNLTVSIQLGKEATANMLSLYNGNGKLVRTVFPDKAEYTFYDLPADNYTVIAYLDSYQGGAYGHAQVRAEQQTRLTLNKVYQLSYQTTTQPPATSAAYNYSCAITVDGGTKIVMNCLAPFGGVGFALPFTYLSYVRWCGNFGVKTEAVYINDCVKVPVYQCVPGHCGNK
jgi:hypothetical protein